MVARKKMIQCSYYRNITGEIREFCVHEEGHLGQHYNPNWSEK